MYNVKRFMSEINRESPVSHVFCFGEESQEYFMSYAEFILLL